MGFLLKHFQIKIQAVFDYNATKMSNIQMAAGKHGQCNPNLYWNRQAASSCTVSSARIGIGAIIPQERGGFPPSPGRTEAGGSLSSNRQSNPYLMLPLLLTHSPILCPPFPNQECPFPASALPSWTLKGQHILPFH